MVERLLAKEKVAGSSPVSRSMYHSLRSGTWQRHSTELQRVGHALNPNEGEWFRARAA